MQKVLEDAIAFIYGRRFSYQTALSQKVTASGSMHSSPADSASMSSGADSSNHDGMEIDNGIEKSSKLQLGRFVLMDSFSNE